MSIYARYSIRCDTCTRSLKNFGVDSFHDTKAAENSATERGWIKIGRNHKCKDCIYKGK